jgi:hypothetical protein
MEGCRAFCCCSCCTRWLLLPPPPLYEPSLLLKLSCESMPRAEVGADSDGGVTALPWMPAFEPLPALLLL